MVAPGLELGSAFPWTRSGTSLHHHLDLTNQFLLNSAYKYKLSFGCPIVSSLAKSLFHWQWNKGFKHGRVFLRLFSLGANLSYFSFSYKQRLSSFSYCTHTHTPLPPQQELIVRIRITMIGQTFFLGTNTFDALQLYSNGSKVKCNPSFFPVRESHAKVCWTFCKRLLVASKAFKEIVQLCKTTSEDLKNRGLGTEGGAAPF